MAAYAPLDTNYFSRRSLVLVAIVGIHVVIVWALVSGVAQQIIETVAPPIVTDIIEEVQEREEPPPPPPPEFERPPVEVPPPEVTIDIPQDTTTSTAITNVTNRPQPPAPPPPPPPPRQVKKATLGRNFPNSEDYYPAASKRLGEEGSPTVKVCIGPNGRLSEEPVITQSSGSARLDEGAVKLAKAGRYVAGTVDGQKTTDCISFRVKFELK